MNKNLNLLDVIKRTFSDNRILLIGFLLSLKIPFLYLLINTIVFGYLLKCGGTVSTYKDKLPPFEKITSLFKFGVMGIFVVFLYQLPFWIFSTLHYYDLGLNLSGFSFLPLITTLWSSTTSASLLIVLLGFVLLLFSSYFFPIAVLRLFNQNNFFAAFSIKKIFKIAFTKNYLKMWFLVTILSVLISLAQQYLFSLFVNPSFSIPFIYGPLDIFPLTTILDAFIFFVLGVFSYTLYGLVVKKFDK